jgi:murein DD-endopeptidase MepM/ murein hydrolase activator NlpD
LFLFLLAAGAVAREEAPRLRAAPLRVAQGGVLFVSLETREPLRDPYCQWLGRSYRMFQTPGGYRSALPVDRLEPAGPRPLEIRADGLEEPLARQTIRIIPLDTGAVETVRLTPELMKLQEDPRLAEESKRIRQLVSTETPDALWQHSFKAPVAGQGRDFGKRRRYVETLPNGRRGSTFESYHRGLDFPLPPGSPVHAVDEGIVLAAESFVLTGNTVFIDHGLGIISAYFHLNEFRVKTGEKVRQGEVIGLVGSTGRSTGPHLHWSMYVSSQAVNPLSFLQVPSFFAPAGGE